MDLSRIVLLLALLSFDELPVEATTDDDRGNGTHVSLQWLRQRIAVSQFRCFQRITRGSDRKINSNGTAINHCNATWDGWLCWGDTEPGATEQNCPDYFDDFDTRAIAVKVCTETGEWARHPDSNRTWTDYTSCKPDKTNWTLTAMIHFYLILIGHGLSLVSLLVSLGIFFYFKTLSCERITLHKNLFLSFVLNSVITLTWFCINKDSLSSQVRRISALQSNENVVVHRARGGNGVSGSLSEQGSCKILAFIHMYIMSCNYFWMLCEGIYLHTLIVVAVFAEKQHLMWYYLLGWGFPLVPAVIYSIARTCYYDDKCWVSSATSLLYIIHAPICAALVVNFFFLLNIIRVIITKLRVTHQAESSLYMRAVRATLILIPLLGIQYVLLAYQPHSHWISEIYLYIMNILMHYQGLLVSTIFCFFNGEVQTVLRRQWNLLRMQSAGTFANPEFFRSAYYVASSLTEVHRCYSIESHTEHMNGKSYSDIFRSEGPYV
ncbi:calcitonin gene-related peptide type 1 receptor isoform X2 [Xiphophorus maculatus]|uniref:calcitonin gene-related peptide type 1 receptor isoform X2 n=1 Tax=Xiphophorus maculatus TaxID=8083 RepID=UPI000C6EFCDF|nr:calcitonin gene-related peptide type 1 receptor isoform X2 [Xiphophorus maculatus]